MQDRTVYDKNAFMSRYFWLAAGGISGTFARYLLTGWMTRLFGSLFPSGTLLVNALGCFLMGLFAAVDLEKGLGFSGRLLLITGFCGAFTTFSTLIFESYYLIRQQGPWHAFANIFVSLAAGFIFLMIGYWLGERTLA